MSVQHSQIKYITDTSAGLFSDVENVKSKGESRMHTFYVSVMYFI